MNVVEGDFVLEAEPLGQWRQRFCFTSSYRMICVIRAAQRRRNSFAFEWLT